MKFILKILVLASTFSEQCMAKRISSFTKQSKLQFDSQTSVSLSVASPVCSDYVVGSTRRKGILLFRRAHFKCKCDKGFALRSASHPETPENSPRSPCRGFSYQGNDFNLGKYDVDDDGRFFSPQEIKKGECICAPASKAQQAMMSVVMKRFGVNSIQASEMGFLTKAAHNISHWDHIVEKAKALYDFVDATAMLETLQVSGQKPFETLDQNHYPWYTYYPWSVTIELLKNHVSPVQLKALYDAQKDFEFGDSEGRAFTAIELAKSHVDPGRLKALYDALSSFHLTPSQRIHDAVDLARFHAEPAQLQALHDALKSHFYQLTDWERIRSAIDLAKNHADPLQLKISHDPSFFFSLTDESERKRIVFHMVKKHADHRRVKNLYRALEKMNFPDPPRSSAAVDLALVKEVKKTDVELKDLAVPDWFPKSLPMRRYGKDGDLHDIAFFYKSYGNGDGRSPHWLTQWAKAQPEMRMAKTPPAPRSGIPKTAKEFMEMYTDPADWVKEWEESKPVTKNDFPT